MQRPFARNFAFKYKSGRSLRHGPRCFHQKARSGLVDGILEGLAGLELRLVRRRDGHRFAGARVATGRCLARSEEHTSELQSLMRISYAVFCLKKKNKGI